jgi:hypothetical protein
MSASTTLTTAQEFITACHLIKREDSDAAGLILADALWKNGKGESAPTDIGAGRIVVNVMPGLGDAVITAKISETGKITYDLILIHPAMGRDVAEFWQGAASLAEVEEILVTIGHG